MKTDEDVWNFARAIMAGAGVIDYGDPTVYLVYSPAEFMQGFRDNVPEDKQETWIDECIEAYNGYFTDPKFWKFFGEDT
jgi:hypothetical protein